MASGTNISPVETGSLCLLLAAVFQAETPQVAAALGRAAQLGKSPLRSRVGEGGRALGGKPRAHQQYKVSFFFLLHRE